jgi:hypothetical protein
MTQLCHSTINFAVMHKSALAHGVVIYRDANWARDLPTQKADPCHDRSGNGLFLDWHFEAR